ncbi:MAG: ATP synthase F0 subunit B, partial [Bacteroidales bacterium]
MELFKPEFGLAFWLLVVFILLFAVMAKYIWPVIVKSVDSRADFIDKGVEYAEEAKKQLEHATENAQKLM